MNNSPKMFKVMFTALPVMGLLVGAIVLTFGFSQWREARATEQWRQTSGIVLSAERTTRRSESSGSGAGGTTYGAAVTYEYEVEGSRHVGTRISLGEYTSSDPSHAQQLLQQYAPGTHVTVHYDPADPSRAVLEPGVGFGVWLVLMIGAAMVAGAAFLLAVFWLVFAPRMNARMAMSEPPVE